MQVTVHLCLLDYVFGVRYRKGVPVLRSVGTRELKQHTGEIVERVRNGERWY
jgi:hypothetical protein